MRLLAWAHPHTHTHITQYPHWLLTRPNMRPCSAHQQCWSDQKRVCCRRIMLAACRRVSAPCPSAARSCSLAFARAAPQASFNRHSRVRVMAMATDAQAAKKVLVPIANGSEEMEAVIVIDVLRRAGAAVTVASVESELQVTCSRNVKLVADKLIGEAAKDSYDLIALPGGMPGAERLRDCATLEQLLHAQQAAGKPLAAICATPAVFLESKGMIQGRSATAHPAFSDKLKNQSAVAQRVVVDGTLTTSRGPGTAFEFALSLVKTLYGEEKMAAVAGPMVMYPHSL